MSGRNIIPRELSDSIRQCLGRKVKLTLKVLVKVETKGDKTENRVLAFASCRLFVLTAKVPTRVDQHFHYLDIQAIESRKPNQLCLTVCDRVYTYYTTNDEQSSHEVDTMVLNLGTALKNIFPAAPLTHIIRKVDVQPPKRLSQLEDLERATLGGTRDMGPCGGFSTQYMCMCDYHALPYREEVAWDVDTIYLSHDTRELYLHDFDYLDQKDLIPIISALEYNTWFRKLRASHSKLSHEAIERILHVVSKSLSLEELYLDNIGAKAEFANKLSLALLSNSSIPLQKLDLSHNPLEDKGLTSLCGLVAKLAPSSCGAVHISNPIGRQAKGLCHLNLSYCGLTSKGVNMLSHSLSVNKYMGQTLTFLSLAGNSLRDDVNNLYNFLAQPNVLKSLDLSGTECAIDAVFGALLRGCTSSLAHLNISRNGFGSKKTREMLPSFKQYFTSTLALKSLNLSSCKLPADALKNVLLGLACNENISEVELDLSSNQLGTTGAQILESCIHGVRCLSALDISDNGLEAQLGPVVSAISKNKSIHKLTIGRNLHSIKSKYVFHVMEAVVHMIQEEDCVLESLSFSDSRLKTELHNLLNALGSNHCLQSLDISGNYMGDSGARLLAKALQINSKLQYISYDRNNVTLLGYSDIAYALQSNHSVKFMPFPVHDAMLCMKTAPERTENIMRRIQDTLYRNVSPIKYSNGQAFRLQQGFLLSSTQQQVDRLVLQTGEVLRALKRQGGEGATNNLQYVDGLIGDADNSKQLISHLHDVVIRRDELGNPIETKLHQLSTDLHNVITNYLQDTVESMVRCAQDKCPNVLAEEKVVDDIRAACLSKSQLPGQLVEQAIAEQAGSVLLNKVNEVNLAVASTVSDRVIDEVVDSLSKAYKSLQSGEGGTRKRASTGAEMGSRERGSSESSSRSERSDTVSQGDDTSQKSDPSPLATPQLASKRKSLHGRKLRPQSVVERNALEEAINLFAMTTDEGSVRKLEPCYQEYSDEDEDTSGCVERSKSFLYTKHERDRDILLEERDTGEIVLKEEVEEEVKGGKSDLNKEVGKCCASLDLPVIQTSTLSCGAANSRKFSSGDIAGLSDDDTLDPVSSIPSSLSVTTKHDLAESLDSVSELPSSCGQLQHLGKARPKRVKTRAPTRPMGRAEVVEEDHDISEGVDTFFRPGSSTPTTPLISPDSENSPRLLKYESMSSVDSSPHTGGGPTGSERGSMESLTRSDPLARSESDIVHRQRIRSRDTEEEDEEDEKAEEEEEPVKEREEKSRSVSSLIGKLASEAALKRSPDMNMRKASTSSSVSISVMEADKNRNDEEGKEDSPPRRMTGVAKYGMGIGGNILAEMKARQEKRISVIPKDDDKDKEERRDASSGKLLTAVKLRSTGLADSLKSPTNGYPRGSGAGKSPPSNRDSSLETGQSPSTKPVIAALKLRLPPPLAPKPRPKSMMGVDVTTGDYESSDAPEEEGNGTPQRSVRELAASLNKGGSGGAEDKKKSSSLPRNSPAPAQNAVKGERESGAIKTADIVKGIKMIKKKKKRAQELKESCIDAEEKTDELDGSRAALLQRQTSHKHVLTNDLSIEDVVNV
ncbi:F-actin-uncapping protein LRRC16A-like isoform X4 [Oratosquilla oratoria]|uniref:F-actin-uncapping protein LRRC16A-like isoform X4 n=1 Tax=Oratosquilla oratoria TaxID=337810 RepID=UPI003F771980